jgi:hypothetical protein
MWRSTRRENPGRYQAHRQASHENADRGEHAMKAGSLAPALAGSIAACSLVMMRAAREAVLPGINPADGFAEYGSVPLQQLQPAFRPAVVLLRTKFGAAASPNYFQLGEPFYYFWPAKLRSSNTRDSDTRLPDVAGFSGYFC